MFEEEQEAQAPVDLRMLRVVFRIRPCESEVGRLYDFTGDIHAGVDDHRAADDNDEIAVVGTIEGAVVPELGTAREMLEIAKHVSDETYGLATLPWALDHRDPFLPGFTQGFLSAWVGIQHVRVEDKWRGQCIGYAAMRELVLLTASNVHTLITMKPRSAVSGNVEHGEAPTSKSEVESSQRYWHTFGLRPIGGTGVYGHGLELQWPGASWMRTHR